MSPGSQSAVPGQGTGRTHERCRMHSHFTGLRLVFGEDAEAGLCLGAGFQYSLSGMGSLYMNYAFQDFGILNSIQKFSIGLGF